MHGSNHGFRTSGGSGSSQRRGTSQGPGSGRTGRRHRALLVVGLVAVLAAAGCSVFTDEPDPETLRIGVDLELTGDGAALGTIFERAIRLRADQINDQGLAGGFQVELQVLDNRSDPATAAENLRTLAADPAVSAIISGPCDECVIRAVEDLNAQGVPTVSLARAAEVVQPVDERAYIFKLGPDANHNATLLSRELSRAGAETMALVTTTDRYGENGRQEMTDAAERADLDVPVNVQVVPNEESVSAAVSEIMAYQPDAGQQQVIPPVDVQEGPDGVVIWAPPQIAGDLAAGLRDEGYQGDFFLDAFAADQLFVLGSEAEALDGATMIFTETLVIDEAVAVSPAKAARQAWFRDYTATQGTYHAYSSFGADAVNVIVDAVTRFDSDQRGSIRDAIENTLLDGLTGPIRINTENHSGLSPQGLTTVVVQGDRWRLAS